MAGRDNPRNLAYQQDEPAFLKRLRAGKQAVPGSQDFRHKRAKVHDEDDAPLVVDLKHQDDPICDKIASATPSTNEFRTIPIKHAEATVGFKKRPKAIKTGSNINDENSKDKSTKKTKVKPKVKLAFDNDNE
ncbi:hypothetical protein NEOLI_005097 [Neolecta irregularis DAH-3]|uniref:DUF4604 domain-containing protein n=1 Tax=Neolecta irregularis (strain DAH-3) TaxID=1198029 RepID=A0A1U7LIH7_NEOID|nr:hypothetical protein NEOLI_005097 [Neolecta irregularis DAH-3]|eukprot:OLL22352.1 hypothetical protein NEOLI_005097 [Neolecta irregularis DAH-3]